jgi:hypothetical protein
MSREKDYERLSNLAGLDTEGALKPPPSGIEISREPNPWWPNFVSDQKPTAIGIDWATAPSQTCFQCPQCRKHHIWPEGAQIPNKCMCGYTLNLIGLSVVSSQKL